MARASRDAAWPKRHAWRRDAVKCAVSSSIRAVGSGRAAPAVSGASLVRVSVLNFFFRYRHTDTRHRKIHRNMQRIHACDAMQPSGVSISAPGIPQDCDCFVAFASGPRGPTSSRPVGFTGWGTGTAAGRGAGAVRGRCAHRTLPRDVPPTPGPRRTCEKRSSHVRSARRVLGGARVGQPLESTRILHSNLLLELLEGLQLGEQTAQLARGLSEQLEPLR